MFSKSLCFYSPTPPHPLRGESQQRRSFTQSGSERASSPTLLDRNCSGSLEPRSFKHLLATLSTALI